MKKLIILLFMIDSLIAYGQADSIDKELIRSFGEIKNGRIDKLYAPFIVNELIYIYPQHPECLKKDFSRTILNRTKYTMYCHNVISKYFKEKMMDIRNRDNAIIVDSILTNLDYDSDFQKPDVDWGRVFSVCETCPFGESPTDQEWFIWFSIMFMGEQEIQEMVNYKQGEQWKYFLLRIENGDTYFWFSGDYFDKTMDTRISQYIIDRWKDCTIPEVQELVIVLERMIQR